MDFMPIIHYGTLEVVLEIITPQNCTLQTKEPHCFLLALVDDCKTDRKDAAKDTVTFRKMACELLLQIVPW
jgi:hypothetical protein